VDDNGSTTWRNKLKFSVMMKLECSFSNILGLLHLEQGQGSGSYFCERGFDVWWRMHDLRVFVVFL